MYSIKKRALLISSLVSLVVFILMFLAAYNVIYHETEEVLNQKLQTMAEWLSTHEVHYTVSQYNPNEEYEEEDVFVDIWPTAQLSDVTIAQYPILSPRQTKPDYYRYAKKNKEFIAYVIPLSDMQIQVAQPIGTRRVLALELAGAMLVPYLIILPIVFVLLYLGISRAFRPIHQLQQEFAQREYYDLTPVQVEHYPIDLHQIIAEANALFVRIEQAQQEQSDFIAHAAHELRSPLTALNLQAQVLEKEYPNTQSVQNLRLGIKRLHHLVQQLLDLARQGDMPLQRLEQINIQQLLKDVVQDTYPLLRDKDIDLALITTDESINIDADQHSMYLVLRNIIDNAIQYSPAQGTIEVSLFKTSDTLDIVVEDSGYGINESEFKNVMEKFYRINNVGVGSGLGLAIVKKALQRMQGKISFAKSQRLGGLLVKVSLPLNIGEKTNKA